MKRICTTKNPKHPRTVPTWMLALTLCAVALLLLGAAPHAEEMLKAALR